MRGKDPKIEEKMKNKTCSICGEKLLISEFKPPIRNNRCRVCTAKKAVKEGKKRPQEPSKLVEEFPAEVLAVGLDRSVERYVFARRSYGQDMLGWHCPTDEGLKRVIQLSYTASLDNLYPFFIILSRPMYMQKSDERFRHFERVLREGLGEAMERGKSVQFRQHASGPLKGKVDYNDYYSPCQVVQPQIVSLYRGQAFVDMTGFEFPDKALLEGAAISLSDKAIKGLDHLYSVITVAAWASKSAGIKERISQKFWDGHAAYRKEKEEESE